MLKLIAIFLLTCAIWCGFARAEFKVKAFPDESAEAPKPKAKASGGRWKPSNPSAANAAPNLPQKASKKTSKKAAVANTKAAKGRKPAGETGGEPGSEEVAPVGSKALGNPSVTENSNLSFFLTDVNGGPVPSLQLERDSKGFYDLIFRAKVPESLSNYLSWGFEATDPQERHYYQMAFEGNLPEVIHWDGVFSDESEVRLNKKYFYRLVLVYQGEKILTSPWRSLMTISKKSYEGPKNRGEYITLYVMPDGGTHALFLKTKSQSFMTYPSIYGDFKIHLFEKYMCGMGFSTTANTLFGFKADPNSFGFSDIAGFCRYRFLGSPLRAPVLPLAPTYMGKDFKPTIPEGAFGKATNLEAGLKLFYTTLRGFAGSTLDNELFQSATGLSLTANFDQAIWWLRGHASAEIGYSVFNGSIFTAGGQLALTYERLKDVSPGVEIKYSLYQGSPPADQTNAGTNISNSLLFLGVMGYFKL